MEINVFSYPASAKLSTFLPQLFYLKNVPPKKSVENTLFCVYLSMKSGNLAFFDIKGLG